MVNPKTFLESFVSAFSVHHRVPDMRVVRTLCIELLADVPGGAREAMLLRLDKMRRADDVSHLHGALFDVLSRFHGERIARERIGALDEKPK